MYKKDNINMETYKYFIILFSLITTNNAIKHYKIYKDFNKDKKIKILNPEKVRAKLNNKDQKRILLQPLGKDILKFKKILAKRLREENLNILYNNLKTLESKQKLFFLKNLLLTRYYVGNYNPELNKITILKEAKNDTLYHELFHVATSIYDKKQNATFIGFCQINYNEKTCIGLGLTEGYTENLTKRYFKKQTKASEAYEICEFFSKKLEEILGEKIMHSLYFSANLPKLIQELKNYDTEENIINFIKSTDYILEYINHLGTNSEIVSPFTQYYIRKKLKIYLQKVENSLINWYIQKEEIYLKNKLITKDKFIENIKKYYISIRDNTLLLDKKINILGSENIENFLNIEKIKKYN